MEGIVCSKMLSLVRTWGGGESVYTGELESPLNRSQIGL
jgi:hypothetical protein